MNSVGKLKLYTRKDFAKLTGYSERHLRRLLNAGKLARGRVCGKKEFWTEEDIKAAIQSLPLARPEVASGD